jgi:MFS family permease
VVSPSGPEQGGIRALLRSPAYRRLLVGQGVSSLGDWVATFALVARAFDLTGSPTAVGGVLVIRLLPSLLAAPVGGVLADHLDRRFILVSTNVAMAGLISLVPFVGMALIYVIAFVSEVLLMLSLPSRDATVPDLVPASSLPQANGMVMGTQFGLLPVGAALFSGLRLLAANLPGWLPLQQTLRENPSIVPFFFDALTFVIAAALFAGLPPSRKRAPESLRLFGGLSEAVRAFRGSRVIQGLAVGIGVALLGGGVLFAVGIGYIRETLCAGAETCGEVGFGFLASSWGLGMALGLGVVRFLLQETGSEPVAFRSAVFTCGVILMSMAVLPFMWLALVAAVLFGLSFSMALMLAVTMVQKTVEERLRGRLLGGAQMLFRLALAVGALGVGGAASLVDELRLGPIALDGNQFGLILGGGLILLGGLASRGVAAARAEPGLEAGG